jgi:hypothetical protein
MTLLFLLHADNPDDYRAEFITPLQKWGAQSEQYKNENHATQAKNKTAKFRTVAPAAIVEKGTGGDQTKHEGDCRKHVKEQ